MAVGRAFGLLARRVLGFVEKNPGVVLGLLVLGLSALLSGALANTQNQTQSLDQSVQQQLADIVCPIANLITNTVVKIISLLLFIGAILYYLGNDSRSAKGLALAAVIAIILANTFTIWQRIFTGQDYNTLCSTARTS